MNKKILLVVCLLVAVVGTIYIIKPSLFKNTDPSEIKTNRKKVYFFTNFSLPFFKSEETKTRDLAWDTFQKYLNYNKNLDVEGVKSIVFKLSDVCSDPKTTIDCQARMGAAYNFGKELKKGEFTHVWSDDKQLILSTDFWEEENDLSIGRFRAIIFFIKDESGNLKLLSFNPSRGVGTIKNEAPHQELLDRVTRYTEDLDNDGKEDYLEECLQAVNDPTCKKTDPKERDTDQNGWWDGTEIFF